MTEEAAKKIEGNMTPAELAEQERYKAGNAGKGKYLEAYQFTKGCNPVEVCKKQRGGLFQKGNPGRPKGWINKTARLKHEMLDVMGMNRKARMKVLTAALEKDGLRYLNILASLLPKEQIVDLSVRGGLSVLAAQMTDEELLRLAMATEVDVLEQDEETNVEENKAISGGENQS